MWAQVLTDLFGWLFDLAYGLAVMGAIIVAMFILSVTLGFIDCRIRKLTHQSKRGTR